MGSLPERRPVNQHAAEPGAPRLSAFCFSTTRGLGPPGWAASSGSFPGALCRALAGLSPSAHPRGHAKGPVR